jgi:hypothetical protein
LSDQRKFEWFHGFHARLGEILIELDVREGIGLAVEYERRQISIMTKTQEGILPLPWILLLEGIVVEQATIAASEVSSLSPLTEIGIEIAKNLWKRAVEFQKNREKNRGEEQRAAALEAAKTNSRKLHIPTPEETEQAVATSRIFRRPGGSE